MLVKQRKHTLYFFITVNFTLAHLQITKAPAIIPLPKVQKLNMDKLTVYERSETPI